VAATRASRYRAAPLPIPLQIVACLLVGLSLALAAHRKASQGRSPFGREGWVPILYQVVLVLPVVAYLGAVHPAWSWLYLVDPQRLPFGTLVLALVGASAAMAAGYLSGWALVKARRTRELVVAIGLLALGLVVTAILVRARLGQAGTFADFLAHDTAPLGTRKLGWALTLVDAGLLGGLALCVSYLVNEGQRDRG
jgi:ABC-type multidrug transport system permease subunit